MLDDCDFPVRTITETASNCFVSPGEACSSSSPGLLFSNCFIPNQQFGFLPRRSTVCNWQSGWLRNGSVRWMLGCQSTLCSWTFWKLKRHFEKGYTPNWTEELFVIDQILPSQPVTYKIRDLADEPIVGSFYELQLQKTTQSIFR